ncbi:MAG: hypothetical protein QOF14_441 [Hyphomicrobiales bacterium]|jgi:hypothetical protein|nr:hypothetical protein [Hyphomicrobiales bacterium]
MAELDQAAEALWEVRPAPLVGGRTERRDFEVRKRGIATKFIVTLPWNERRPGREQEEYCRDVIFRLIREIAAQETLSIRR